MDNNKRLQQLEGRIIAYAVSCAEEDFEKSARLILDKSKILLGDKNIIGKAMAHYLITFFNGWAHKHAEQFEDKQQGIKVLRDLLNESIEVLIEDIEGDKHNDQ